ncbi:hypothetical protein DL93DRAFT_1758333 [Clavulina sp. PMI_390]|nr:hypothetical protein DL93DRAFT_1758333 [Clavulina sp. PMI_390]
MLRAHHAYIPQRTSANGVLALWHSSCYTGLASLAAACHLSFQTSPISPNPNEPSSFSPSGHRNIPQQPIAIIPPAASVIEMEDRISLFWTIFCLDRFASISGGTSPLIPDKDIWTSWPRDPSEWKSARTDIPSSMPTLVPETLLPVLDYTSGSGDVSRLIPQNPLSFRAIAAFLLERIHRVSKASSPGADQLSLLQRRYNDPNLRQSWDSIKAAAQKIEHCLPFIPSPFAASQAQLIGGEPNAHSLGTGGHSVVKERSASPPAFHAPLMAEPCRGTPYPSTSSFPQTPLSSVPHSPNVTGQGFAHQSTPHLPQTSILGDPSHAAGLLLAHSALCATRIGIHLGARYAVSDTAPPINDGPGNNADYYRPSHPQSQPSLQTPTSSRPQAMYHGPQLIRPSSTNSTVFFQQPSTTASPVVTASDVASWPIWNAPFTSGFPPNAPQYPHSPLTLPPHSFTPQPQSLERPLTSQAEHTADLPILLAAGKIAELASLAMQSHGVFEELDMMIRWCWIPALDVLRGEIQRQEQELSSPYSFSQTSYQYPPGGQHPMNKPATPTHPLDYSSSLPRLRAQRDHLQRALDRLNVMFQQGGTCSSLSSSSSASPAITPSSERGSNAVLCGFDLADASGR